MALDKKLAIVSLEDAKRYLNISVTTYDRHLDSLVMQASVLIQKELGYNAISQSYKEYYSGNGGQNIWLNHIPVTSVDFVAVGRDDALTVEYDATDASYATAEVTKKALKLRKRVAGVLTANTFQLSDYATLTALVTAIDALSGWDGTAVTTFANYSPESLVQTPARDVNDRSTDFEVPDNPEYDYELFGVTGRLYTPYRWSGGNKNIYVEYTAGYDRWAIPEPLESATLELIALIYNMSKKDASLKSEKLGDYSYTVADRLDAVFSASGETSVSNLILTKIKPYRRVLVMGV